MLQRLVKRASSAVPKVIDALGDTVNSVVDKVSASVPKLLDANGDFEERLQEAFDQLMDGLDPDLQEIFCGVKRGKLRDEAFGFATKWQARLLDYQLKKLNKGIESIPVLNTISQFPSEAWDSIKEGVASGVKGYGNFVNDLNIPIVSDYVGALTGVREGESNIASTAGAFVRGVVVKGVGETVDGLVTIVVDPLETAQGLSHLVANVDEMAPEIKKQVEMYVDEKLIYGSPEERAEFAGQVVFEVASCLIGAVKAGTTTAKVGVTTAKMATKADDIGRVGNKIDDVARLSDDVDGLGKVGSKTADAGELGKVHNKANDGAKLLDNHSKLSDDVTAVPDGGVHIKSGVEEATPKKVEVKGDSGTQKDAKVEGSKEITQAIKDNPSAFKQEEFASSYESRIRQTPARVNVKVGFEGNRGESLCILKPPPDPELKQILDKAGIGGIQYRNGVPDFSSVSKAEVEINYMLGGKGINGNKARNLNFEQANIELAKKLNKSPELAKKFDMVAGRIKPSDIEKYRVKNNLTWHELNDTKTIQLVPTKINSTFGHVGGVGEINAGAYKNKKIK